MSRVVHQKHGIKLQTNNDNKVAAMMKSFSHKLLSVPLGNSIAALI